MARTLLTRLGLGLATLVVVSIVVFAASKAMKVDPAKAILFRTSTPEQIEAFRHKQGLDQGPVRGYVAWAGNFVRGDWGMSLITGTKTTSVVLPRLGRSILLAVMAFLLGASVAFLLGVFSGKRAGTPLDVGVSFGTLTLAAIPEFVVGVTLLLVFATSLHWFPVTSAAVEFGTLSTQFKSYVLPVLTLALVVVPYLTRQIRAVVREVAAAPYVRAAALRGVPLRTLTWRYVIPASGARVASVYALILAELMAGVVVVESVFSFPGIGRTLVQSINAGDIAVIQASALIIGAGYIALNFAADGLSMVLDPRRRRRADA